MRAPAVDPAPLATSVLGAAARRALALGRAVAGTTGPNPPVGCVLIRDGEVVGEGATAPAGGPHAEIAALAEAGVRAQGATAVVTLEPCAHTGRTGPCADALASAGVTTVRFLVPDPNPLAAGGAARLRAVGVDSAPLGETLPAEAADATHDLRGFLSLVATGRPHVLLKLAQDVEGRTVPPSGGYLTSLEARTRVHRLRADVDAVLIGGATLRQDDPRLDVRLVPASRQPRPVIVTASGDVPAAARLLARRPIVIAPDALPAERLRSLRRSGADVAVVADVDGFPTPAAMLEALVERGVLTVLAEPGPRLAAALLAAGVVDAAELHVAGSHLPPRVMAAGLPGPDLALGPSEVHGPDLVMQLSRRTRA